LIIIKSALKNVISPILDVENFERMKIKKLGKRHLFTKLKTIGNTGSFTTRALEKKRKQEIAFGCVILKKKKSSLKDIRQKTT
jgi:hypothetical protein